MLRKAKSSKLVEWTRKPQRPPRKASRREDLLRSGGFPTPGTCHNDQNSGKPLSKCRTPLERLLLGLLSQCGYGAPRLLRDPQGHTAGEAGLEPEPAEHFLLCSFYKHLLATREDFGQKNRTDSSRS